MLTVEPEEIHSHVTMIIGIIWRYCRGYFHLRLPQGFLAKTSQQNVKSHQWINCAIGKH